MVQRECATEMIAYIPAFPPKGSELECMAIVVLKMAHNHPVQPSSKPGVRDAMQLDLAVDALDLPGLTVQKLVDGAWYIFSPVPLY